MTFLGLPGVVICPFIFVAWGNGAGTYVFQAQDRAIAAYLGLTHELVVWSVHRLAISGCCRTIASGLSARSIFGSSFPLREVSYDLVLVKAWSRFVFFLFSCLILCLRLSLVESFQVSFFSSHLKAICDRLPFLSTPLSSSSCR
jgi:hypothetical protein